MEILLPRFTETALDIPIISIQIDLSKWKI